MATNSAKRDLRHIFFEGKMPLQRQPIATGRSSEMAQPDGTPASDEPLDEFCVWVLERAGLNAAAYRSQSLHRRLPACLRALKARSTCEARLLLERNSRLVAKAVGSLLIGVTEFFREPAVFDYLQTEILPAFSRARKKLRIWSAACSTGAELYSMAILLEETGLLAKSYLLGTDCREEAINLAKRSLYPDALLKLLPRALREKYLVPSGQNWRPVKLLRRQVYWKTSDLLSNLERGPWDTILWRNTAIYLKSVVAERIWRRLVSALAPGGVLIVGKAERPPQDLGLCRVARCVYRNGLASPANDTGNSQPSCPVISLER